MQEPMNGCTYFLTTYTFFNGTYKKLFEPKMVPLACEGFDYKFLQSLVFLKNKQVYFLEKDLNSEKPVFNKKVVFINK